MKKIIIVIKVILINFLFAKAVFSSCELVDQYAIPESGSEYHGGIIFFEKSLSERDTGTLSLRSRKHNVPLDVLYSNKSELLLRPSLKLQEGQKYSLYEGEDKKPFYWTISKSKNNKIQPLMISSPQFVNFESNIGCGGWLEANFSMKTKGAYFILAELLEVKSGILQTQIITRFDNKISIIESLCGGGVQFTPRTNYKVRFKLISEMGKESSFSEYVSFRTPDSFEENEKFEVSGPRELWNTFLRFIGLSK